MSSTAGVSFAFGGIFLALGIVLILLLLIGFVVALVLKVLFRSARGAGNSEDRRRADAVLSDIRRGVERMDQRIASLETILLPESRTNGRAR